jgi:hypothetical protein
MREPPGKEAFWFPAKRHGWGWGPPVRWQGWVALAVYIVLLAIGVIRFPPARGVPAFLAVVMLGSLGFGLVCWWKGEPPRWRWGEDKPTDKS